MRDTFNGIQFDEETGLFEGTNWNSWKELIEIFVYMEFLDVLELLNFRMSSPHPLGEKKLCILSSKEIHNIAEIVI